ncbi:MAG: ornithine cyclodeaminase family protein [Pseudomonadales bacterium]
MNTLVLSADHIAQLVEAVGLDRLMDDTIDALHAVLASSDAATIFDVPKREGFAYSAPASGLLEWMPLHRRESETFLKLVGYHPDNPSQQQLPTVLCSLLQFDAANGRLETLADGTLATAVRTGAASAVASRVLASPGAQTLGLIGAGAQALTQLHALSRVFALRDVYVCDADPAVAASFAARAALLALEDVRFHVASAEQVAANAEVLCTVTSVAVGEPAVFADTTLKPGIHINAVGSDFPGKTELPLAVLERSLVCPDYRAQALHEGESQRLQEHVLGPELIDLVHGAEQYAAHQASATVFDSTGFALEDYVVLGVLRRIALEHSIGAWLPMSGSADPLNPYAGLRAMPTSLRDVTPQRKG